jgi:DNA-binding transcriptional ArsR family regulator
MPIDLLRALADPTRLQIVEAMRLGECAVTEIVDRLDIHQSGVSRHLRILHEAGVVQVRPDGQRRLYSLRREPFQEMDAWIDTYRRLWDARLDRFGAALERGQSPAAKAEPR